MGEFRIYHIARYMHSSFVRKILETKDHKNENMFESLVLTTHRLNTAWISYLSLISGKMQKSSLDFEGQMRLSLKCDQQQQCFHVCCRNIKGLNVLFVCKRCGKIKYCSRRCQKN